mgnify:CR=1 FL=1
MRDQTIQLLTMIDEGLISAETVAKMCLKYMSEYDVADMMRCNDIIDDDVEEDSNYGVAI